MKPMDAVKPPVGVETLIAAVARDTRVAEVHVYKNQHWDWGGPAEGVRYGSSVTLLIKANTVEHGTLRGIPSGEAAIEVAHLLLDRDQITHIEFVESAPYGLVHLVELAIG